MKRLVVSVDVRNGVLVCGVLLTGLSSLSAVEIRVAAYNTYNNPDNATEDAWFSEIFSAIGNDQAQGLAKRLDAIALAETDAGSADRLVDILNGLYGVDTYDVVTSSSDGAGDRTGVVFDSSTLTLLDWTDLPHIGFHTMMRAHLQLANPTTPSADFYVYAIHLKAGSSSADKAARTVEAENLRSNADALGEDAHVIYAGDFNLVGSSEGAWTEMLSPGNSQAMDPVDSPGEWRDDEAFLWLHTQYTSNAMDDRFDLQLASGEFFDDQGLEYILGSYRAFGNNATHTLNGSISTGSGASPTVLAALESASDHLPVVVDYRLFPIPEPSTLVLLAMGAFGLLAYAWRKRRR